jgi:hypothetical protein
MHSHYLGLLAAAAVATLGAAHAAISIAGSSTLWNPISGNYDYLVDQQTGQPASDIVGSGTNYGFFVTFDNNGNTSHADGTLGFRIRLDAAGGTTNNPAFDRVLWVGVDGNGNGSVDMFIGVSTQGSTSTLGLYGPGDSANISPKTTSISSTPYKTYAIGSSNYNYRPVNYTTDGGTTNDLTTATTGDPDYYLSFTVPFADVAAFLGLNASDADQRPLRYVVATSTQHNSLNQDLGAVNGGIGSASTWEQLGGFTPTMNASGIVLVPEPSAALLFACGVTLAATRRRRAQ